VNFRISDRLWGAAQHAADLVDLAYPGVLPVLNARVWKWPLNSGWRRRTIARRRYLRARILLSRFAEGHQISQYELPVVAAWLAQRHAGRRLGQNLPYYARNIWKRMLANRCTRLGPMPPAIDLNAAGTPLLRSFRADMRFRQGSGGVHEEVHTLVRYLEISTAICRKARFAAMPMCRCGPRAKKTFGHAR